MSPNLQLTADGKLRHLLTLDGLPARILTDILDTAESFISVGENLDYQRALPRLSFTEKIC